jgi:GT2 family glycosyltransferase
VYPNYDIILVSNGAKLPIRRTALQGIADRVSLIINNSENVGYARANNLGITEALKRQADYILLLNDDTVVSPDFLDILVKIGEESADVGMLGPAIFYFNEPDSIWFTGAKVDMQTCQVSTKEFDEIQGSRHPSPIESEYITGCALVVKTEVVKKIGPLNERFFLYWEDVDWGLRAIKAGYHNLIVPSAHIWHKVSVSTGGPDSPLKAYHKTRSHLLMAKLHAPWALTRLQRAFLRDITWLFFKSRDGDRMRKAFAYLAAIKDYHLGKTDRGPHWLWQQ